MASKRKLFDSKDQQNYEEIKQKYVMKKKKGKSKSRKIKAMHNSSKSETFRYKNLDNLSKKTSKASNKTDIGKSSNKNAFLGSKTNNYLKNYMEFTKKSKMFFKTSEAEEMDPGESEKFEKFTRTYDEQENHLNLKKLNWLKLNKNIEMLTQESGHNTNK